MKPALRAADREAQGVVDHALLHDLVVADEAGVDRQPGGVGGGPAVGPQGVRAEVEHRARAGLPRRAAALRVGGEQLVELARGVVDHEHVAVAVARRAALDRRVRRDRVRARVALVVVLEAHRHLRLAGADVHERDADRAAVPERAEVGVQLGRRPDARHPGGRAGVHGAGGDVGVPRVVGREGRAGPPLGGVVVVVGATVVVGAAVVVVGLTVVVVGLTVVVVGLTWWSAAWRGGGRAVPGSQAFTTPTRSAVPTPARRCGDESRPP